MKVSQRDYDNQVAFITEMKQELQEAYSRKAGARHEGDLRENAEFESANKDIDRLQNDIKEAQALLEKMVISEDVKSAASISVGTTFVVKDLQTDKELKLKLVATSQAAPPDKVSEDSLIGQAIKGKHAGDEISYIDILYRKQKFLIKEIL